MTKENKDFYMSRINGVREYLAFVKQAYLDEEGKIENFEFGKAMGCLDAMEDVIKEEPEEADDDVTVSKRERVGGVGSTGK